MSTKTDATVEQWRQQEYKYGFYTDIETDSVPPGLNEDIIRHISAKKKEPQWMLDWRLKSYRHWLTMTEPTWPNVHYPPIDYQAIIYYSAPKQAGDGPKSLDEVDPKLLETYAKLGIPLHEQGMLAPGLHDLLPFRLDRFAADHVEQSPRLRPFHALPYLEITRRSIFSGSIEIE